MFDSHDDQDAALAPWFMVLTGCIAVIVFLMLVLK
jgi:hypothetical protein